MIGEVPAWLTSALLLANSALVFAYYRQSRFVTVISAGLMRALLAITYVLIEAGRLDLEERAPIIRGLIAAGAASEIIHFALFYWLRHRGWLSRFLRRLRERYR